MLYYKPSYFFDETPRRIYREGQKPELLQTETPSIKEWIKGKESTPEARTLAEKIQNEIEKVKQSTDKKLLETYVDVFENNIAARDSFAIVTPIEIKDTDEFRKKGLLEVLENNCGVLKAAFKEIPDLRLLSYGQVFKEFKEKGHDANYLPIGATVELHDGEITVTLPDGKIAKSLLFPWDVLEIIKEKLKAGALEIPEGRRGTTAPAPAVAAVAEPAVSPELPPPPPTAHETVPTFLDLKEGDPTTQLTHLGFAVEDLAGRYNSTKPEIPGLVSQINNYIGLVGEEMTGEDRKNMDELKKGIQSNFTDFEILIPALKEWYQDLKGQVSPDSTEQSKLTEVERNLNTVSEGIAQAKSRWEEEVLKKPAEVASLSESAAREAGKALGIEIFPNVSYSQEQLNNELKQFKEQTLTFPDNFIGDRQDFFTVTPNAPNLNADGSADYIVAFTAKTGEILSIHVKTPKLDAKKVEAFLTAQEAATHPLDKNTLVERLAYEQTYKAVKEAFTKKSGKFQKTYEKWQEIQRKKEKAAVPLVGAEPVPSPAPEAAPTATSERIDWSKETEKAAERDFSFLASVLKNSTPELWFSIKKAQAGMDQYSKSKDNKILDKLLQALDEADPNYKKIENIKAFQAKLNEFLGRLEAITNFTQALSESAEDPRKKQEFIQKCDDLLTEINVYQEAAILGKDFKEISAYTDLLSEEQREFVDQFFKGDDPITIAAKLQKDILAPQL